MEWRRPSSCSSSACVEVGRDREHVLIRDSKQPEESPQRYTPEEWLAFVRAVKAGEFDDLAGAPGAFGSGA